MDGTQLLAAFIALMATVLASFLAAVAIIAVAIAFPIGVAWAAAIVLQSLTAILAAIVWLVRPRRDPRRFEDSAMRLVELGQLPAPADCAGACCATGECPFPAVCRMRVDTRPVAMSSNDAPCSDSGH